MAVFHLEHQFSSSESGKSVRLSAAVLGPVWTPSHETKNGKFENALTIRGLLGKKKLFFFLSGVGRFLEVQTSAAHSAFFRLWCLSGVPCPVWAPLHESKNRMFENACTIWGLLRKSNFYFFCPGYGRFLRSKLFRTNFSDQEKKKRPFSNFSWKKKVFKKSFFKHDSSSIMH